MQTVAPVTFLPARTHRASKSTALVSLRPRSMRRASSLAFSVGRPGSKLGEAIGLNSTLNLTDPSFGLTKRKSQCATSIGIGMTAMLFAAKQEKPCTTDSCLAAVAVRSWSAAADTCQGMVLPALLSLQIKRVSAPRGQYSCCHQVCTGRILSDNLGVSFHPLVFLHAKPARRRCYTSSPGHG